MIDRRRFMQSSVALGAALATGSASGSRTSANASAIAVVDRQIPGSAAFSAERRSLDLPTLEFTGDVAGLWMCELEPRLRAGPVVIEGHTSAATQFCLEFLARDFGARTVHRVESGAAVTWILSSSPARRAALAPIASRGRESHA
jgi:hypothetical protein